MPTLPPTMGEDKFLEPCEHRIERPTISLCKLVSEKIGHDHGIFPRVCAHCRLHGSVDQAYINQMSLGVLLRMSKNAMLGYYTQDQREAVFDASLALAADNDTVAILTELLAGCVKHGRMERGKAKALAMKHQAKILKSEESKKNGPAQKA